MEVGAQSQPQPKLTGRTKKQGRQRQHTCWVHRHRYADSSSSLSACDSHVCTGAAVVFVQCCVPEGVTHSPEDLWYFDCVKPCANQTKPSRTASRMAAFLACASIRPPAVSAKAVLGSPDGAQRLGIAGPCWDSKGLPNCRAACGSKRDSATG